MSEGDTTLSFQQLIDQLKGYCSSGQSGTLFIKTQDNRSARITLDRGEIIACAYSMKRGTEALPLIRSIRSASYAFTPHSSEDSQKMPLPGTVEIMAILQGTVEAPYVPAAPVVKPVTTKTATSSVVEPTSLQNPGTEINKNEAAIEQISSVLTKFIGPLASVLCNDYVSNQGPITRYSQFVEMIEVLSDAIGSEKEKTEFKKQSMIMLGKDS